jgi:tRNA(Ile)-lysidine synthase
MHELSQKLLRTIRKQELLRPGDRVAAAVSGGADSVALLLLLEELREELGIVLSVAHVNHKLRGAESDEDERFVADFAGARGLECHFANLPLGGARSTAEPDARPVAGLEAKARKLRYDFFRELARESNVNKIATAHTLDDQAETLLLRIFRGTGIRGLAGVHPRLSFREGGQRVGEVVRPLLSIRRTELRDYLQARGQPWREDSSNENLSFTRNRVRQRLLPLIAEEFGERAIEHMAELAEIARAEEEWAAENQRGAAPGQNADILRPTLEIQYLLSLPLAVARRLVRSWIELNAPEVPISFRLIEEVLELARAESGKKLELAVAADCPITDPSDAAFEDTQPDREQQKYIRRRDKLLVLESSRAACDYEYPLNVPGSVFLPDRGTVIKAEIADVETILPEGREALLDPQLIGSNLVIRNWRAGDRYWPAHTAAGKKVKELLSDRHLSGAEKKLWPVVLANNNIVWMKGFAAPQAFRPRGEKALWIREVTGP